ncbi:hypothetical protein [Noviherbaspirillum massiliense]|uniref:hypothetical protein n=1 Tax=Noviherbaspirillum massiliense TaxID=1465823 RepID=UPI0011DDEC41|nr:hypothetical protein [Noviherbaspirillum massiliense]
MAKAVLAGYGVWLGVLPTAAQGLVSPNPMQASPMSIHAGQASTFLEEDSEESIEFSGMSRLVRHPLTAGWMTNAEHLAKGSISYTRLGATKASGTWFAYAGEPDGTGYGWRAFPAYALFDSGSARLNARDWLKAADGMGPMLAFGYVWHDFRLEGSTATIRMAEKNPLDAESPKLRVSSETLSYRPSSNWTVQLARRYLSSLDQFEAGEKVRRTALAATYSIEAWRTTLAWGRTARSYHEPTLGYLMESIFQVNSAHTFFGRVEQVGSDMLMRESGPIQKQISKVSKFTLGYFYNAGGSSGSGLDIGALAAKYRVPSAMGSSYRADPVFYLVFVRLKMQ